MSTVAEDVLFLSLTDTDALETLAATGIELESIPTETMRPVVSWALDRFFESGRTVAPSRAALLETWGQVIEDARVDLLPEDEDADTIQWAIEQLHSQFVHLRYQQFIKDSGMAMATAAVPDRTKVLAEQSDRLFALVQSIQRRHMQVEFGAALPRAVVEYRARAEAGHTFRGLRLGLGPVDDYTYGIHPGEVAMIAGGPKMGKSYLLDWVAKEAWDRDEITALFTLENSVEMTVNRMVCLKLGISAERWQRGLCLPQEVEQVQTFIHDDLPAISGRLEVIMPEPGKRNVAAMIRQAQVLGAKAILVDQTSHVEHPDPGRKPRNEIVGDILSEFKTLLATGAEPMAGVIAHQISREGVKAARKLGYLEMEMLAESASAERVVDFAFGLYQSRDDRTVGEAVLQMLASRRTDLTAWKLVWRPSLGLVNTIGEIRIEVTE